MRYHHGSLLLHEYLRIIPKWNWTSFLNSKLYFGGLCIFLSRSFSSEYRGIVVSCADVISVVAQFAFDQGNNGGSSAFNIQIDWKRIFVDK